MTIQRILTDAHVEVEMNLYWRDRDPEKYAKQLDQACKDFLYFVRDHRSQDINDAYVVREYGYKCDHCGWKFKDEPEEPDCCDAAILEWASPEQLEKLGIEKVEVNEK